MQYRQQKRCRTTEIAVFGTIDHNGCRRIVTHTPNREEEGRQQIGNWSFWRGWREGGDGEDGYGENMGMIITHTNPRTYMATVTEVLRSSLLLLSSSYSGGGVCGDNSDDSDNNDNMYDVVVCCSPLQRMGKISEVGSGRGRGIRRGRGRRDDDKNRGNCNRVPDARAYAYAVHAATNRRRRGAPWNLWPY